MDELNEIDGLFKSGLENAQITPPAGVWEGIAASVSTGAAASSSGVWLLAARWVGGIVFASAIAVAGYFGYQNSKPQTDASTPQAKTQQVDAGENANAGVENGNVNSNESDALKSNPNPAEKTSDFIIPQVETRADDQEADGSAEWNPNYGDQDVLITENESPYPEPAAIRAPKPATVQDANEKCKHTLEIVSTKITNTTYSFMAKNPSGEIVWRYGDGAITYGLESSHEFSDIPGYYEVKVYSNNNKGCRDSAKTKVKVAGIRPVLTNAFTPNGDGSNDTYFIEDPHAVLYELVIYDMQNRVVFKSNNPQIQWDGNCNNNPCPAAKYKVVLNYQYPGDAKPSAVYEVLQLIREKK
ncbi:MAG: gliding motility-associated C-terminal domain-containing protein [Bacteroidia bacterium]|nr:gliding motility-associated C-terminal domain-containing protein [Bacteroidia bacterium]